MRLAQLTKQAEDIRAKIAQAILEDSLEANKKVRFFFFCREFSDLGYIKRNWGIFFCLRFKGIERFIGQSERSHQCWR